MNESWSRLAGSESSGEAQPRHGTAPRSNADPVVVAGLRLLERDPDRLLHRLEGPLRRLGTGRDHDLAVAIGLSELRGDGFQRFGAYQRSRAADLHRDQRSGVADGERLAEIDPFVPRNLVKQHGGLLTLHALAAGAWRAPRAEASNSFTSSSDVCAKFRYVAPTAKKGSGVAAQTTSSATSRSSSQVSYAAAGTATTTRETPASRSAATAARIVEPVARPSSTTIASLSPSSGRGVGPRYSVSRRSISRRSRAISSASSWSVTPNLSMT